MFWGVDVGSTYTKIAGIDAQGVIIYTNTIPTIIDQDKIVREHLQHQPVEMLVSTGYGRYMLQDAFSCPVISEIKAHAKGAHHTLPSVQAVIDLGGQDSKIIKMGKDGSFTDFKMNDKCAAGTGKFLEIAANRLGLEMEVFSQLGFEADKELSISSMCAVFAESEVISLIAQKESAANICYGVHDAIAKRLASMARNLTKECTSIAFTGGGARNTFLRHLLSKELGVTLDSPAHPQLTGALGAALSAKEVTA